MRRTVWLAMVVAAATVASAAGTAEARVVENDKFQGNQVFTEFFGSTDIACGDSGTGTVSTFGFLTGTQMVTKSQGSPKTTGNAVLVDVLYSNSCTGESHFASGAIIDGFGVPNRNLTSATLQGSALVQDFGDGTQFVVAVNVTVAGSGSLTSGRSQDHTRTITTPGGPFTITEHHSANANRAGVATGTVTVAGFVITPQFDVTTLSLNANSQIVIAK